jgi:hypothetical protein
LHLNLYSPALDGADRMENLLRDLRTDNYVSTAGQAPEKEVDAGAALD